jgi:nitroimidazol reductase NimA-like FMN-containing flavoprotein (pyridoxamine 5'-phosphate oxidase superfamily)
MMTTTHEPHADAVAPVDHAGMEVLTWDECLRLAASEPVGRIAFLSDGDPIVLPVNHTMVDHFVVFRTITGTKLSAVELGMPVAFEVDRYDPKTLGGWSVLFRGKAEELDADDMRDLDLLSWVEEPIRDRFVRIQPDIVTGRRILGRQTG